MFITQIQVFWFLLFILQTSISFYLYRLYRKDHDKRKLIFSIGILFISLSHIYEAFVPFGIEPTLELYLNAAQYWVFFPLLFALFTVIHNRMLQAINSKRLYQFYILYVLFSFPLFIINPVLTAEYAGDIGLFIGGYLILASFFNVIRSKTISDLIFLLSLSSYLIGALGLLDYIDMTLSIFGFFTANSYIILVFLNPYLTDDTKTSNVKDFLNIKKELEIAKAELTEKEKTFQTLFNQLADPVMILDKKGKFIELTDRVKEYTGFEKHEILGKNFLSTKLLTQKSKAICIKNLMKRMAGIHVGPYEVEAMTKDGHIIPFEVNAQKIRYNGQKADLVIFRDISERVRAQQHLRESEERYRNIFDQACDGVFIHDLNGNIIDVNHKLTEIFGYTKDEFHNLNSQHIKPFYAKTIEDDPSSQLFDKGSVKFETEFQRKNKETFIGSVSLSVVHIGGEKYIQGIVQDVTEKKEAERKLNEAHKKLKDMNITLEKKVLERTEKIQQLLKQKDDFINQLGHDLKNPLGPLINLLPLLENKEQDPQKKEILNVLTRNATYMKNLVVKTIELAKLNSPNTTFHFTSLNISEVIRNIIGANQLLFKEKNITINDELQDNYYVYADKLRMEELFNNLLNNAVKYTEKNGTVTLKAQQHDEMVTLILEDTGIGMTQHQIQHIFDEFYKADESRHDFDSSGLGMPICKRIVDKHNGEITVESDGLGQGSRFTIRLPTDKTHHVLQNNHHNIIKEIDNLINR